MTKLKLAKTTKKTLKVEGGGRNPG